ncbi:MAG: hypothetical protein JWN01_379, partial [Patescibacteria group bacterium]|nr:hypothetical protein [Patescibacteria group bacterium]
ALGYQACFQETQEAAVMGSRHLNAFIDGDGIVTQWPTKSDARVQILAYLAHKFELTRVYSEPEVNEVLKRWHTFGDWPLLRRELVEHGYLERDRAGREYRVGNFFDQLRPRSYAEAVLKWAQSGTALEIGAYLGNNAVFLADHGFKVTAIEPERKWLEDHRSLLRGRDDIEVVQADMLSYTPDRQFDVVVCTMVLHFLEAEEIDDALAKLRALVAPGGCLVVASYVDGQKLPEGYRYQFPAGALRERFEDWDVMYYDELAPHRPAGVTVYKSARLIARRLL